MLCSIVVARRYMAKIELSKQIPATAINPLLLYERKSALTLPNSSGLLKWFRLTNTSNKSNESQRPSVSARHVETGKEEEVALNESMTNAWVILFVVPWFGLFFWGLLLVSLPSVLLWRQKKTWNHNYWETGRRHGIVCLLIWLDKWKTYWNNVG